MKLTWRKRVSLFMVLLMLVTMADGTVLAAELPAGDTTTVERGNFAEELPDNDELFAMYVDRVFHAGPEISLFRDYGESVLEGMDLGVYHVLKDMFQKIASGERTDTTVQISLTDIGLTKTSWTTEELGVTSLVNSDNYLTAETSQALKDKKIVPDINRVMDCLLYDCPYDLYWYDKVQGYSYGHSSISISSGKTSLNLANTKVRYAFSVAEEYAGSQDYTANAGKTGAATNAAANAERIVQEYADYSDYEKLEAYSIKICDLVDYNHEAVEDPTTPYGNPWQLIWVFDEDPTTKVVCEGYSKAFQYLCDLSDFSNSSINCYTVNGVMAGGTGAGGHMWNVVTMYDGKNYLVDVTNSDEGSIGSGNKLFLVGMGGTYPTYSVTIHTKVIQYEYDGDICDLYGEDILTLSQVNFDASLPEPTPTPTPTPTAKPTPTPTPTPTAKPTSTPTAAPTAKPTSTPTATPTAKPTSTPTAAPTAKPTSTATATPTAKPTSTPTTRPTSIPTIQPTAVPTTKPTSTPTTRPTSTPTTRPTSTPTTKPTSTPTTRPTATPTTKPTSTPTTRPTSIPTIQPTAVPTTRPTATPTIQPTAIPTVTPAVTPAVTATPLPTLEVVTPLPAATATVPPIVTPPVSTTTPPAAETPQNTSAPTEKPPVQNVLPGVGTVKTDMTINVQVQISNAGRIVDGKIVGAEVNYVAPVKAVSKVVIPTTMIINGVKCAVVSVAENAFRNDKKLTSVTVGENVKVIGKNAFANCKKMKKIILSSNLTKIEANSFSGCKKLKTLTIRSKKLKSIGKNALKGIDKKAVIYVPKKMYAKYKKLLTAKTGYKKTMKLKKI